MTTSASTSAPTAGATHQPITASSTDEDRNGRLPSDLARRISSRRKELGIGIDQLAKHAGIDPVYLRYFESSPDAQLSAGTMNLVAVALNTTPTKLHGGVLGQPLGHGRAGSHPVLDELTQEQCEAHLAVGGIGRILMMSGRGPVAVPVNFEFTNEQIVFSTDVSKAKRIEVEHFVGFEVDRIDQAISEGWSVLVTGRGRRIRDAEEYKRLATFDLEAWAGGDRHALVAITADCMTGRVIIHESLPDLD